MIPPKLGDMWIPKILIDVGKYSHHAILDLGSSVNIISKELYDLLDLDKKLEKCDTNLLLADDSTKQCKCKRSMLKKHNVKTLIMWTSLLVDHI
jgi:hypothetical protein